MALPPREAAWLAYQAVDQSDDIVLLLESSGATGAVLIAANGAFRRASGHSDAQLAHRPVADLFPPGEPAAALLTAIRDRATLRTELACHRAGGGSFMFGLHLMPAPERTPGRPCCVILGRDITAQLEARRMQDSIQRLLAKVFTSVDEAVAIINAAGRIVMANPRLDQLLGYQPNQLVGRNTLDLVEAGSRAAMAATIQRHIARGGDLTFVAPLLRADGTRIVVSLTSVLVSTDDTRQFRIVTLRSQAVSGGGMRVESAGRIRLVGLDEVRVAMGDRWQAVAERSMATAETVIKRRCGPEDSYSRADETSFLICFGVLGEQAASFRAAMIGREIRDRLIGQGGDPDTAYVRSIAAAVRFPDTGAAAASLHTVLLDGLDTQMERIEREARHTLSHRSGRRGLRVAADLRAPRRRNGRHAGQPSRQPRA